MRARKLLTILFLAVMLVLTADARRSGGSRSRSSSYSSSYSRGSSYRSGYRGNYYSGLVIIAGPGGTYYYGYGGQCPGGCAINGRCGTEAECTTANIVGTIFGTIFMLIFCCVFCCICAGSCAKSSSSTHVVHHERNSSHSSHSNKSDRIEPLVMNQPNS